VPTDRIASLEDGRFSGRQGTFVGVGKFPRVMHMTLPHITHFYIEDGGDDLPSFVRLALPMIDEFVKARLMGYPQ
jgi:hypothetical protein